MKNSDDQDQKTANELFSFDNKDQDQKLKRAEDVEHSSDYDEELFLKNVQQGSDRVETLLSRDDENPLGESIEDDLERLQGHQEDKQSTKDQNDEADEFQGIGTFEGLNIDVPEQQAFQPEGADDFVLNVETPQRSIPIDDGLLEERDPLIDLSPNAPDIVQTSQVFDEIDETKELDDENKIINEASEEDTGVALNLAPTHIALLSTTISEFAQSGDVVGQLEITDVDSNNEFDITLSGEGANYLTVDGHNIVVKDGVELNHEEIATLNISVSVTDSFGNEYSEQFSITVVDENDEPVFSGIEAEDTSSGVIQGQLVATDEDDDSLIYSITENTSIPDGFSLNEDGSYSFDPSDSAYENLGVGDSTVLTIPVTVTDDEGASDTSQIQITITGTNDAPVAGVDVVAKVEEGDSAITGQLTSTDTDVNSTASFTISDGSTAPDGFTLNADGSYNFDPSDSAYDGLNAGDSTVLTIPVTVTDDQGATDTSQIQITITGTNDAPIAGADVVASVDEGDSILIGQLNSSDSNDGFSITSGSSAPDGFTLNEGGSYSFDPSDSAYDGLNVGDSTVLTIPVTVTDDQGATDTSQIQITITGTNDAPIAGADVIAKVEEGDSAITGQLTSTDADDNSTVSFTISDGSTTPDGFTLNEDGSYNFDPSDSAYDGLNAGDSTVLTIPVTVTDDQGAADTSQIQITITGTNDAPFAGADVIAKVEEGDSAITGQLTSTDADDNSTVSFAISDSSTAPDGFTLNEDGSYSFDPSDSAYDGLNAGDSTVLTIPVTVTDDQGATDTSQIQITITGTNDAPIAGADVTANVEEGDASITGQLSATDIDDNSTASFIVSDGSTSPDGFELNADGSYSFDPTDAAYNHLNVGDSQVITVPVTITDDQGATDTSQIQITVIGTNDAPIAGADVIASAVEGDASITGQLSATDVDDNSIVSFTVSDGSTSPDGFTLNADGSYSFDPSDSAYEHIGAGDSQVLTIPVTVTDDQGATDISQIQITVTGTNDAPIAGADVTAQVDEGDTSITGQLTSSDVDDGATASFSISDGSTAPDGFELNADGSYTFDPSDSAYDQLSEGETQLLSIPVTVSDEQGETDTTQIEITITGTNDLAEVTIVNDFVAEDETTIIATALDIDGSIVNSSLSADHGTASLGNDGNITYVPDANFNGADSVTIEVTDNNGGVTVQTINLTIDAGADSPVAVDDTAANVLEDSSVVISSASLIANDFDVDGDTLSLTEVVATDDTRGTVELNGDGDIIFTPEENYHGEASFEYTVSDGTGEFNAATVSLTIENVNDVPVITVTDTTATEDTAQVIATTSDIDGTIESSSLSADHGTVTLDNDDNITYTPDADYNGTDTVSISVTDNEGGVTTQEINLTIDPTQDNPVAVDDAGISVTEDTALIITASDLLANDTDADGDTLSISAVTATADTHGTVTVNDDGDVVFTPDANYHGEANFEYTVSDGHGGEDSAVVTLDVTSDNDAPVITIQSNATINEDGSLTITSANFSVTDIEDGAIAPTLSADNGSVEIVDGNIVYTPNENYNGSDTLTLSVTDSDGATTTQNVGITVNPQNDDISQVTDTNTADNEVTENVAIGTGVGITLNAIDIDGDAISYTIEEGVPFSVNADGKVVTSEVLDFETAESYTFNVTATSADGSSSSQEVTVNVNDIFENNGPNATDDSVSAVEDTTLTITTSDLLANDSDVDGDTLNITAVTATDDTHGTIELVEAHNIMSFDSSDDRLEISGNIDIGSSWTLSSSFEGLSFDNSQWNTLFRGADGDHQIIMHPTSHELGSYDNTGGRGFVGSGFDASVLNDGKEHTITAVGENGSTTFYIDGESVGDIDFQSTSDIFSVGNYQGGGQLFAENIDNVQIHNTALNAEEISTIANGETVDNDLVAHYDFEGATLAEQLSDKSGNGHDLATIGNPTVEAIEAQIIFTPEENYYGEANFEYTVADGNGGTEIATVNLTVDSVNDVPVINLIESASDNVMSFDSSDDRLEISDNIDIGSSWTLSSSFEDLPFDNNQWNTLFRGEGGDHQIIMHQTSHELGSYDNTSGRGFVGTGFDASVLNDGKEHTITAVGENGTTTFYIDGESVGDIAFQSTSDIYSVGNYQGGGQLFAENIDNVQIHNTALNAEEISAIANGETVDNDLVAHYDFEGATLAEQLSDKSGNGHDLATSGNPAVEGETKVTEDTAQVIATTTDIDGTIESSSLSADHGTVTLDDDGNITYTPDADYNGADTVSISVTDNDGGITTKEINLTIDPTQDNPIAVDNTGISATEDTAITITASDLLSNDSDADGDTLTISEVMATADTHGTVSINDDGDIVFTPEAEYSGEASFEYTVSDGNGGEDTATVSLTVENVNDAPVITVVDTTATEDTAQVIATTSDIDGTIESSSLSADHGTVTLDDDGNITYTPDADYNGVDTVSISVTDNEGGVTTQEINLTIDPTQDSPVAVDDGSNSVVELTDNNQSNITISESESINLNASESFSISLSITPDEGQGKYDIIFNKENTVELAFNDDGNLQFALTTENENWAWHTTDVSYEEGAENNIQFSYDGENVTINNTNSAGETQSFTQSYTGGIKDFGSDLMIGNRPLGNGKYSSHGEVDTISMSVNGTEVIQLNFEGNDQLIDSSGHGNNAILGSTASIIEDTANLSTEEGTAITITASELLANDSDADGDTLMISEVTATADTHGTIEINDDGDIVFTPDAQYHGEASFEYTISDGQGGEDTATVSLTVDNVNDAPVITVVDTTATEDTAQVIATTSDIDGTIESSSLSADHGTVTLDDDGNITYTPDADYNGADIVSISVTDNEGGVTTQEINLTIDPAQDSPVAVDDSKTEITGATDLSQLDLGNMVDGASAGVTVTAIYAAGSDVNLLEGIDDSLDTNNAHSLGNYWPDNNAETGFNYMGGHDWFTNHGITESGNDLDGGIVSFSDGTTGVIDFISNGHGSSESAYIYYKPYENLSELNSEIGTVEDVALTISSSNLLANDTDADGDTLSIAAVSATTDTHGTVEINDDGNIVFTPEENYHGEASFEYTISDGNGGEDTATVSLNVDSVNDTITQVTDSNDDANEVAENLDAGAATGVTLNATDADGDAITYSVADDVPFEVNENGEVITTESLDFETTESYTFDVTATGADGTSSTQSITIDVNDIDDTIVNTTADLVTDSGVSSTDNITNDATPTIEGTTEAGAAVVILDAAGNEIGTGTADSDGNYRISTSELSDGAQTLSITATDTAGNSNTTTQDVEIDTSATAGTVTVDNITADDILGAAENTGNITVTGSASGGDVSEGDVVTFTVNGTDYSTTVQADGSFSADVAASDLAADTSFDVNVQSSDAAGNSVTSTITSTHTVDITASDTSNLKITDIVDNNGDHSSITMHGTGAEIGNTVSLYDEDHNVVATTVIEADGSWNIDISDLPGTLVNDNEYFTVTETDAVGNESEHTESTHFQAWNGSGYNTWDSDDFGFTGSGDDTLTISDNDSNDAQVSDGGDGTDVAIMSGNKEDYTITTDFDGNTIVTTKGNATDSDGDGIGDVNEFRNIETITFDDGSYDTNSSVFTADNSEISSLTDSNSDANVVAENLEAGATTGVTLSATDADDDAITYSVAEGVPFTVNENGEVVTTESLDFEIAESYTFDVTATSADGSTSTQSITIDVNDIAENIAPDAVNDALSGQSTGEVLSTDDFSGQIQLPNDDHTVKIFEFGEEHANETVSITFDLNIGDEWEAAGQHEDIFSLSINGETRIEDNSYSGSGDSSSDGIDNSNSNESNTYTVVAQTDADGNVVLDFAPNSTNLNGQENVTFIDSFSITTGATGNSGDVLVNQGGFTLDQDESSAQILNFGSENAGKEVTISFDTATTDTWETTGQYEDNFSLDINGVNVVDEESNPESNNFSFNATVNSDGHVTLDFSSDMTADDESLSIRNIQAVAHGDEWQASSDGAVSEDSAVTITAQSLLANDTDANSDDLSITVVTASTDTHGTVELDSDGNVVFTPEENYHGEASFEYTISDGQGGTDTATVTLEVDSVNDTITQVTDSNASENTIAENVVNGTEVGVTAQATDAGGDAVTYSIVDADGDEVIGGAFAVDADTGVVTVKDNTQIDFEDTNLHNITVKAESADGSSSTQSVAINVTDVIEDSIAPDAPIIIDTSTNFLINGDAENGSFGWENTDNLVSIDNDIYWTAKDNNNEFNEGENSFAGHKGDVNATQEIDISGLNGSTFTISGITGGYRGQDTAQVNIVFKDADENTVGSISSDEFSSSQTDGLNSFDFSGDIPDGAISAVVELDQDYESGSYADQTLDNLQLNIFDSSGQEQVMVSGTAEIGTIVTVYDGLDALGETEVGDDGIWTLGVSSAFTGGSHVITATATDKAGNVSESSNEDIYNIEMNAVSAITDTNTDANEVVENLEAGAATGVTLNATDADGDAITYSVADDVPFSVNDNGEVITTEALDFETTESYTFDATATSADGSSSTQSITINVEDVIEGTEGRDRLYGTDGDDVIHGNGGNDIIYGSEGADVIDGGEGRDSINYRSSDEAVSVNLESNEMSGGYAEGDSISNIERVTGSDFADSITGSDADNTLFARGGDDVIDGGAGNDWIGGGAGADVIDGGEGRDTAAYGGAEGVNVNLKENTASGGEAEGDQLSNIENIAGTNADDRLTGDEESNFLSGKSGDDILDGGAGDDRLTGGYGDDVIHGGEGDDYIVLKGEPDDYSFVNNGDGTTTVTDLRSGNDNKDGTDIIDGIEQVRFDFKDDDGVKHYDKYDLDEVITNSEVSAVTDINVAANEVAENLEAGAATGVTLSATDADGDAITYSVKSGVPFTVNDNGEVVTTEVLDFETTESYTFDVTATSADSTTSTQSITIDVSDIDENQTPSSNSETQTLSLGGADTTSSTNVTFIVDVSSSMSDNDLELTESAIAAIIEKYDDMGDVNINVVQFWGDSNESTGWQNADSDVSLYTDKSGTDPEQGLIAAVDAYDGSQPNADNNAVFVFSDGNSYGSYETDFDAFTGNDSPWENFISDNDIDLHTVGVNTGDLSDLNTLASAGDHDPIYVNNVDDLSDTINSLDVTPAVTTASVSGNVLNNVSGGDGAHSIDSTTIDGDTYTVDNFPDAGLTTDEGAVLQFDFDTGDYTYRVSNDSVTSDISETFTVSASDADGDSTSFSVTINVDVDFDDEASLTEVGLKLGSVSKVEASTERSFTGIDTSSDGLDNFESNADKTYEDAESEIIGTSGNDDIYISHDAKKEIDLKEGDDRLYIGEDADKEINLGAGNDSLYIGDDAKKEITAGDGNDQIFIDDKAEGEIDLGAGNDHLSIGGDAKKEITAGDGNDHIEIGDKAESEIDLGAGNDYLSIGGDAKKEITAGDGNDQIFIDDKAEGEIDLGAGNDHLSIGGDAKKEITAGDGNDHIEIGDKAESEIDLGAGNDYLSIGGDTKKEINAGDGDDHIVVGGDVEKVIDGGKGTDSIELLNYTREEYDDNYHDIQDRLTNFENFKFENDSVIGDASAFDDAPVLDDSNSSRASSYEYPITITAELTDTDGSESISSIVVTGIPDSATLSSGTDNGDGSRSLTTDQLDGLSLSIPDTETASFDLSITVTSTESNGGDTFVTTLTTPITPGQDAGITSINTVAGSGNDRLVGGDGNDTLTGGDGADTYFFNPFDGSDTFHAGEGGGWTDVIRLDASSDPNVDPNDPWTITIDGEEVEYDLAAQALSLDSDSSGVISLSDGSELAFDGVDKIEWGG